MSITLSIPASTISQPSPSAKIIIQNDSIQPQLNLSSQLKKCRHCHEPSSSPNDPLLSPCSCIFPLRYTHITCLNTWLTLKYQEQSFRQLYNTEHQIFCEDCKRFYQCNIDLTSQCATLKQIKQKIQANHCFFIVNSCFILINIMLMVVISFFAVKDSGSPQYDLHHPRFFLVLVALGLVICSLTYGIYQFVKQFMQTDILNVRPSHTKKAQLYQLKSNNEEINSQAHASQHGLVKYPQSIE